LKKNNPIPVSRDFLEPLPKKRGSPQKVGERIPQIGELQKPQTFPNYKGVGILSTGSPLRGLPQKMLCPHNTLPTGNLFPTPMGEVP